MIDLTQYGPYICVGLAMAFLFVIWSFFGGEQYEFVGISPLNPPKICPVEPAQPPITVDQTPVVPAQFASTSPPAKKRFVSKGEKICCQTMEKIYGVPFVSARPGWLTSTETGKPLELDCYNEQLQIAVEYNGEQHYKWPNFTNQTHQEFINQVRRDVYKTEVCRQQGVYLITVPYNVKHNKINDYIISQLPETLQERLRSEP